MNYFKIIFLGMLILPTQLSFLVAMQQEHDTVGDLLRAIDEQDVAQVKLLLDAKVKLNEFRGWDSITPLYLAVKKSNIPMVKLLLHAGADINLDDFFANTPLHKAVEECNIPMVELLLDAGADINQGDFNGNTPLHKAVVCRSGNCFVSSDIIERHNIMAKLLLDKGANVNGVNGNGSAVLHQAVFANSDTTVKLLIDNGANVNNVDNRGWTALHVAAFSNLDTAVKLLIDNGADVTITDNSCRTALGVLDEYKIRGEITTPNRKALLLRQEAIRSLLPVVPGKNKSNIIDESGNNATVKSSYVRAINGLCVAAKVAVLIGVYQVYQHYAGRDKELAAFVKDIIEQNVELAMMYQETGNQDALQALVQACMDAHDGKGNCKKIEAMIKKLLK